MTKKNNLSASKSQDGMMVELTRIPSISDIATYNAKWFKRNIIKIKLSAIISIKLK